MPLPLTANQTDYFEGDGTWKLIASDGNVLAHSKQPVPYGLTPTNVAPAAGVAGHPFEPEGYALFRYTATLSSGQHLWMKPDNGVRVEITVTAPAS